MKKRHLLWFVTLLLSLGAVTSCSETENEDIDEYANWQQRNDNYFAALKGKYSRLKVYYQNPDIEGPSTSYIYYEVLEEGEETDSPASADTVLLAYRGRLIPSVSYSQGYEFDRTFTTKDFEWNTAGFVRGTASSFVNGFTTALFHMHPGDRWRVYIPYALGYGATAKTGIPAYSTLIFEIAMKDWWNPGEKRPDYY